jgi:hypothetical protein
MKGSGKLTCGPPPDAKLIHAAFTTIVAPTKCVKT